MKKSYITSIIVEIISIFLFIYQLVLFQEINIFIIATLIIAILNAFNIVFNILEDRDIREQQKSQRVIFFQNLYDKFKNEYRHGIEDEIIGLIKSIGKEEFERRLDIHINDVRVDEIIIQNDKWKIHILNYKFDPKGITLYDKIQKTTYFYEHPDENIEVKENFLEYYRAQCRKNKIRIIA